MEGSRFLPSVIHIFIFALIRTDKLIDHNISYEMTTFVVLYLLGLLFIWLFDLLRYAHALVVKIILAPVIPFVLAWRLRSSKPIMALSLLIVWGLLYLLVILIWVLQS